MFIIFIYYFISLTTIWLGFYFRRFTEKDYKYNNTLKWKRRIAIMWTYLVIFLQAGVFKGRDILFFYPVYNPIIIGSSAVFIIIYIFSLNWVETIKHPFNKKKKLK